MYLHGPVLGLSVTVRVIENQNQFMVAPVSLGTYFLEWSDLFRSVPIFLARCH